MDAQTTLNLCCMHISANLYLMLDTSSFIVIQCWSSDSYELRVVSNLVTISWDVFKEWLFLFFLDLFILMHLLSIYSPGLIHSNASALE